MERLRAWYQDRQSEICALPVRNYYLIEGGKSIVFGSDDFQAQERREVREEQSESLVRSWRGLRRTNLD